MFTCHLTTAPRGTSLQMLWPVSVTVCENKHNSLLPSVTQDLTQIPRASPLWLSVGTGWLIALYYAGLHTTKCMYMYIPISYESTKFLPPLKKVPNLACFILGIIHKPCMAPNIFASVIQQCPFIKKQTKDKIKGQERSKGIWFRGLNSIISTAENWEELRGHCLYSWF